VSEKLLQRQRKRPPTAPAAPKPATGSVIGSAPERDSGVASATNTTALQLGGALGVAVVGSLLDTRYQDNLAVAHLPHAVAATVNSSLGGALAVAARAGGVAGQQLAELARGAFISGMDLGLLTAAVVALAGAVAALAWLPRRSGRGKAL
jgi:hypothetical protein